MRVLIAVPTFETIYPDTFKGIYDLDKTGHEVDFEYVRGYDCAKARNVIAGMTIDKGYDYVFMVDSDVAVPKDALQNLIENHRSVIMGFCAHRKKSYDGNATVFKLYDEAGKENFHYRQDAMYSGKELKALCDSKQYRVRVHGGGTACILIKADVFRKIKYPWFKWTEYSRDSQLSEDLYFCDQCKKAKIPIYVDTRVSCGHIFRYLQYAD